MSVTHKQRREAVLREVARRTQARLADKGERRTATLRAAAKLRWAASAGTHDSRSLPRSS